MTDPRPAAPFPRPAPAAAPGPLDDALLRPRRDPLRPARPRQPGPRRRPLGLHTDDDLLGDGSRDAAPRRARRRARAPGRGRGARPGRPLGRGRASSATSSSTTSAAPIFDTDGAPDLGAALVRARHVGDGLFLLFARDHAPLPERLDAIAGRLEAVATYLEEAKTRATVPQVRLWQQIEIETAGELPAFFDEIVAAGEGVLPAGGAAPPRRAPASRPRSAIELYAAWLEGTLADGTDDWAIGRERHDEMVALRAFDGLDADAILELGWERLAEERDRPGRGRPRDRPGRRRGRRSSTGSRPTTRRRSRRPSRPTARRCSAPARTSSSTTS